MPQVTVVPRSGAEGIIPESDAIYVTARGHRAFGDLWLDALHPSRRHVLARARAIDARQCLPKCRRIATTLGGDVS
jgi:hypothetical protein